MNKLAGKSAIVTGATSGMGSHLGSAAAFPEPARAVAAVGEKTVLKRLGRPEDVTRAALFLASSDSDWITGTALTIDGGIMTGA